MTGMPAPAPVAAPPRRAIAFIFATLTLDVLSMGVVIPVLPRLIEGLLHGEHAESVRIGGVLSLVWAIMQFVFTPIQGALSDRFGRRPVLLLSMTGLGLDYALTAHAPNLAWLFVARAISGMTAASFSTANAYVTDVTPPEKRAGAYGLLGAAFGIGFVLGPALGGWAGSIDPRLPFWIAAALSLLNALYGYFILPESLPPSRRSTSFSLARANPIGALRLIASQRQLASLGIAQFFYYLGHNVYPAVFVWFTMYRYGWTARQNGLALAATGVCSIVVQGLLVGRIVPRIGERRAVLTGLGFGILGFLIYAFGRDERAVWIAIPVAALWGLYGPAAQTLMSRRVGPSEQGRLQGALGSMMGVASMISPPMYTTVFATAIDRQAMLGAPFFVAALMLSIAFVLSVHATQAEAPAA